MERPFVGPVLALMLGMVLSRELALPPLAGLALGLVGLLVGYWRRGDPVVRLKLACVLVGMAHQSVGMDPGGPGGVAEVIPAGPTLGWVRGKVADPGSVRKAGPSGKPSRTLELDLDSWRPRGGEWKAVEGRVRIRFRDSTGIEPSFGHAVQVFGIFREPAPPELPGGFDFGRHLAVKGVHRVGQSDDQGDWHLLGPAPVPRWSERFLGWAHRVLSRGVPDDAGARLVRSMVLGWREGLEDEWRDVFLQSGTLHVFAISGLHIALVSAVLVQVLRLLRVDRGWCGWLVVPLTWAYVAATGWQASAVRAGVMSTVVVMGWALRRPSDLLNSLAASAWIILWADPSQLFQAGFQLSFGVVAGMVLWVSPLEAVLERWVEGDGTVPEVLRPRLSRWARTAGRWLAVNLATSLAAWVTALPLGIHYFQLVSVSGLVANLVVVPLSGICLVAGLASVAVAPVSDEASAWMNQSAWFWMRWMMKAGEWAAAVPGGDWRVAAPSWPWWLAYGWAWFWVLPRWLRRGRFPWRWAWPLPATVVAAATVLANHSAQVRMTCLPYGAGVLVEEGWGKETLLDAGSSFVGQRVLPEWLATRGINRLDDAVACAAEARFAGGWSGFMESTPVGAWWTVEEGRTGGALRKAHDTAHDREVPVRRLVAGRKVGAWEVLWPPVDEAGTRSDDRCLVLQATLGGVRCCVIPSLNPEAQRRLVARWGDRLRSDLVIAGMPSRGEPLIDELLSVVRPSAVVLLVGERPANLRLPRPARLRIRRAVAPGAVWVTDEAGAVTIRMQEATWTVEARL
jgi:ComEC/Rec2-related protein